MSAELITKIDRLLEHARPGGLAHKRLLKYRNQLTRNVMLGPSVMNYIRQLAYKADDISIECRFLTELGKCRKNKLACTHVDDNRECGMYKKNRPQMQGNPIGRVQ